MLVCFVFLGIAGLLLWVEGACLLIPHVHTVDENISAITNTFINAVTT